MSEILAKILLIVFVFGGICACGIKALMRVEQCKFLPKRFTDELKKWETEGEQCRL